jgi:hypothetical protein
VRRVVATEREEQKERNRVRCVALRCNILGRAEVVVVWPVTGGGCCPCRRPVDGEKAAGVRAAAAAAAAGGSAAGVQGRWPTRSIDRSIHRSLADLQLLCVRITPDLMT